MLLDMINRYALWIFAACFVGILAALVVLTRSYREGKTAPFSFLRDAAMVRAQRALYVIILLFLIAVGLAAMLALTGPPPVAPVGLALTSTPSPTAVPTLMLPSPTSTSLPPSPPPSPKPTLRPTATATPTVPPPSPTPTLPPPSPTPTLRPAATPTATAMPTPTPEMATATITPAASPTVAPVVETSTPTTAPVPVAPVPPPGAAFGEITFSRGISEDNQPLEPGTVFAASAEPVYAFFEYRNMTNGMIWTFVWLRDGEEIWRETWEWSWGSYGRTWLFYTPPGGYTPGSYEVRLYIGDELQQVGNFVVR